MCDMKGKTCRMLLFDANCVLPSPYFLLSTPCPPLCFAFPCVSVCVSLCFCVWRGRRKEEEGGGSGEGDGGGCVRDVCVLVSVRMTTGRIALRMTIHVQLVRVLRQLSVPGDEMYSGCGMTPD